ncbi:hypothetical protein [Streptomyces cadmiisoli]|uniref:hypothetical protein n=1 Tax=Streptomyces cadmiisoli TaxID=2184053 RepID=UPI003D71839C
MSRKKQTDHRAVAAACRANPGTWQNVGEYSSSQVARNMANVIRKAYVSAGSACGAAYAPAGTFEATTVLTEFGARVEARYVGSDDADAVTTLTGGETA